MPKFWQLAGLHPRVLRVACWRSTKMTLSTSRYKDILLFIVAIHWDQFRSIIVPNLNVTIKRFQFWSGLFTLKGGMVSTLSQLARLHRIPAVIGINYKRSHHGLMNILFDNVRLLVDVKAIPVLQEGHYNVFTTGFQV